MSFSRESLEKIKILVQKTPRFRLTPKSPGFARAAVFLPLCNHHQRASVLFTKRLSHMKNHPGQVSFPGGKIDQTDVNEVATALREMEEEIFLSASEVSVLGVLPDAIARGTRDTVVTPVVGFIHQDLSSFNLAPNPEEVDYCFSVPLEELLDPSRCDRYRDLPRFLQPNAANHIWGMTGHVLRKFLDDCAPALDFASER